MEYTHQADRNLLHSTFIWCRSTGAYGYLLYGLIILFLAKWLHTSLPLLLLAVGIIYYLYASATGHFDSEGIVSLVGEAINPERSRVFAI